MAVTLQDVSAYSSKHGVSLIQAALDLEYSRWSDASLWPDPKDISRVIDDTPAPVLVTMDRDARQDIISRIARDLHNTVRFPVSTIFLHGIGVLATAMMLNFKYRMYGELQPCNLYIITSQPSGAGKSAINKYFSQPVKEEYERKNRENHKQRSVISAKIKSLKKQQSLSENENEMMGIQDEIDKYYNKLQFYPIVQYTWTDITPEALEQEAFKQNGYFNLVSDEATIINSLLGNMYSDRVMNNEMLLKAWDGELVSTARIGRKGSSGTPHGTISIIAQDETVRGILAAGARGNGMCQRFLLYREPSLIGERSFSDLREIDDTIRDEWLALVKSVFGERDTILTFSDKSLEFINLVRSRYEETLQDTGENGHELLRGVVAKMDKQVMKISCILHVMHEWGLSGHKRTTINEDTVMWAMSIFEALLKTYRDVAQQEGHAGLGAQVEFLGEKLKEWAAKTPGKPININVIVSRVNNRGAFRGQSKITNILREKILPSLTESGIVCVRENDIYINPKFR